MPQKAGSVLTVQFSDLKWLQEKLDRYHATSTTMRLKHYQLVHRARTHAYTVFDASIFSSSTETLLFLQSTPVAVVALMTSACMITVHSGSICVTFPSWYCSNGDRSCNIALHLNDESCDTTHMQQLRIVRQRCD